MTNRERETFHAIMLAVLFAVALGVFIAWFVLPVIQKIKTPVAEVESKHIETGFPGDVTIVHVDGHDYIFIIRGPGIGLTHKADCCGVR